MSFKITKEEIAKRLKKYMSIEAISRYEEPMATELRSQVKGFEITRDNFGCLIMHKKSKKTNAPKVMVAAHMDEVGYMVKSIAKNGNVLVKTVGGIWPSAIIGTKANLITNSEGKRYEGIFGHTSIHILEREKVTKAMVEKEVFVDFGFKDDEQVKAAGIEIGDPIYLTGEYMEFPNDLIAGKAMDNRAGVTSLEMIARSLEDVELNCDLYLVGTVQEEVGCRGAKTSVSTINPQVAFALDTGASHDTTGCIPGVPVLGNGVALLSQDGGTLTDVKLTKIMLDHAKKNKIPAYKYIAEGGGTDAAVLQYADGGAATLTISIPQRYLHSPLGLASLVDIKASADLLVEFIKNFDKKQYDEIRYK